MSTLDPVPDVTPDLGIMLAKHSHRAYDPRRPPPHEESVLPLHDFHRTLAVRAKVRLTD